MIIALQLSISMSIVTMEEEIVGVTVRLTRPGEGNFPNIVIYSFEFPEARAATSRLNHCLLALCGR